MENIKQRSTIDYNLKGLKIIQKESHSIRTNRA
jgi:hypothetical protein